MSVDTITPQSAQPEVREQKVRRDTTTTSPSHPHEGAFVTGTAVALGTGAAGIFIAGPVGAFVGAFAGAIASTVVNVLKSANEHDKSKLIGSKAESAHR